MQIELAHTVLMIEPSRFCFNEEAAETNSFQHNPADLNATEQQDKALQEFRAYITQLKEVGVNVIEFKDYENSNSPDSIFPNNWFSTHGNGQLIIYPMAIHNRRAERRVDIISHLSEMYGYQAIDLSQFETEGKFLEGTGSLIFDHTNKVVYAALSPRTNRELVFRVAELLEYEPITFTALGSSNEPIYHTNVMLSIGLDYAILGTNTIVDQDRQRVIDKLKDSGKTIIEFSNEQIYEQFAGNMLQIQNTEGKSILVISQKAFKGLTTNQKILLGELNDLILPIEIPTIEMIGGGSVRCMLAEIF